MLLEIMKDYWAILVGFVSVVVWLVRMEAKGMSNGREIKRLWEVRKEDREAAQTARSETNRRLEVIGEDIKKLLTRKGGQ